MREFLFNCSLHQDNFNGKYFNKSLDNDLRSQYLTSRAVELCSVISLLILNLIICIQFLNRCVMFEKIDTRILLRTILLIVLVLCVPMLTIVFILAFLYKMLCSVLIKKHDKRFVSFLDSFDVFWSLDESATINVIGIIEADSAEMVVEGLKAKLLNMPSKDGTEKVFYRRNEEYGFYYWRKYSLVDVAQYVQIIDVPDKYQIDKEDLEDVLTEVCNQSLPYGNEGLFKIFVTKQRIGKSDNKQGDYGLIIRIHHSVGDGVALIKFLCRNLADSANDSSVNMFSMPETQNYNSPRALFDMIGKLCEIPLCIVDMILREPDVNALHGPSLLGLKAVKWTESNEDLLKLVKEIKKNVDNLSFSAVLMAALANGLHKVFMKTKNYTPEKVAVILPIRFPAAGNNNSTSLQNNFSVAIHDVALRSKHSIEECNTVVNKLRDSADPLVSILWQSNQCIIKLACMFPKQVLRPLLSSSQATMVFSNMPGPDLLTICEDYPLKSMVFFLPHSGNTGLGVTALTYGGVLRLAVMADRALMTDTAHLSDILDGMVEEIKQLHTAYVK